MTARSFYEIVKDDIIFLFLWHSYMKSALADFMAL